MATQMRITNILPLFLSFVSQDYLSDVDDVKTLLNSLKNHDADKLVSQHREDYAHLDFIFVRMLSKLCIILSWLFSSFNEINVVKSQNKRSGCTCVIYRSVRLYHIKQSLFLLLQNLFSLLYPFFTKQNFPPIAEV